MFARPRDVYDRAQSQGLGVGESLYQAIGIGISDRIGLTSVLSAWWGEDPVTLEKLSNTQRIFHAVKGTLELIATGVGVYRVMISFRGPCGGYIFNRCFTGDTEVVLYQADPGVTLADVGAGIAVEDQSHLTAVHLAAGCIAVGAAGGLLLERRRRKLEQAACEEEAKQAAIDALFHSNDLLGDDQSGDHGDPDADLLDFPSQPVSPAVLQTSSDRYFASVPEESPQLDASPAAVTLASASRQTISQKNHMDQGASDATTRDLSACSHPSPPQAARVPQASRQCRRADMPKVAGPRRCAGRPTRLAPWLFFLLFALLGGAFYFGRVPDLNPPTATAPAAINLAASPVAPRYVTKEIRDIREGDLVLARDEGGTKVQRKRVARVFRRTSDHLRILTFRSPDGRYQTLKTTNEHPFWVADQRRFVKAGQLETGDTFTGPNGELQHLIDTQYEPHPEGIAVFNFEVEDYHTYYVGEDVARAPPLLTHNNCERVYVHMDGDGNVTYYGITNDLDRRAAEHARDLTKRGTTMHAITGPLTHDEARTVEAKLIRERIKKAERAGAVTGSEPIAEQLEKAGLDNLNRGRDPNGTSGWVAIEPEDVITPPGDPSDI